jgi:hypothetical protein
MQSKPILTTTTTIIIIIIIIIIGKAELSEPWPSSVYHANSTFFRIRNNNFITQQGRQP